LLGKNTENRSQNSEFAERGTSETILIRGG
jgi:hypothetical protein